MAQASRGMGARVLFKYAGARDRVPTFLEKYKNEHPFVLTDGTKVVLFYQSSHAEVLQKRDAKLANELMFVAKPSPGSKKIRSFKLSDFAKTPEFGGKFGVPGDKDTEAANASLQYEVQVVNTINKFIKEHKGVINIHIEGLGTYSDIAGVIGAKQVDSTIKSLAGVRADPKADIIVYHKEQDYLNIKNIFISHKKDGGPEAFQQYGGVTETAGDKIYRHREVQKFLEELIPYIGEEGLVQPVMKEISAPVLKNLSIFGPEYSRSGGKFGLQNVQLIGQGVPTFVEVRGKQNTFEMKFPHMAVNGKLEFFTGGYEPVFGATFREGRGFNLKGQRYTGVRVGIYPRALIANRKNLMVLNNT